MELGALPELAMHGGITPLHIAVVAHNGRVSSLPGHTIIPGHTIPATHCCRILMKTSAVLNRLWIRLSVQLLARGRCRDPGCGVPGLCRNSCWTMVRASNQRMGPCLVLCVCGRATLIFRPARDSGMYSLTGRHSWCSTGYAFAVVRNNHDHAPSSRSCFGLTVALTYYQWLRMSRGYAQGPIRTVRPAGAWLHSWRVQLGMYEYYYADNQILRQP